ncbi:hypothetical protein GCM10010218_64370 [Streptomyces mashuensis]|uniref:Secreted protein n=1 Tax=Streptomyces mashuensis TaxID=33904 RepID=A0A919BB15_9ACTN|nr:DUF5719 family protein [Streptomyces mashuensis]GHF74426.1 hypothetical protein GCM10010218_64370 [Streptomyces mashuensis]
MKATTLSLFAVTASLAVVTGVAALNPPPGDRATGARATARVPVQRTTLLCPAPGRPDAAGTADTAETAVTAFTPSSPPGGDSTAGGAAADLVAAAKPATDGRTASDGADAKEDKDDKAAKDTADKEPAVKAGTPVLSLRRAGVPVTRTAKDATPPALLGTAEGPLAPGWSAQLTTTVTGGTGRGLYGVACAAPDTSFWFPGASAAKGRRDYLHLTNPDSTAAVVDVELYGKDGRLTTPTGEGVNVPPRSTVPVLVSSLTDAPEDDLTVHVAARTGRVGAAVHAVDDALGGDWLSPAADVSPGAVLPGIPADATSVRLVALATGPDDADVRLRLAGPDGSITPAGHETLHVRGGTTTAVELADLTRGEAGSLLLVPERGSAPVVAALRVTRGSGEKRETAFVTAGAALGRRGTLADNRPGAGTLSLTAADRDARVRVTASAGSGGGRPVTAEYTVRAGTTLAVRPPRPAGGSASGTYALTVERLGGGPVYGSRMLAPAASGGVPAFTIQPLTDDRSTVLVPEVEQDVSVLLGD